MTSGFTAMNCRKILLLLVILLLASSQVTSQSATGVWSQLQQVATGWFPSITVDITGRVHVAWADSKGSALADLFTYATAAMDDSSLSKPIDVIYTGDGGYTLRSAIDVTSDGTIFALIRAQSGHEVVKGSPADHADSATAWTVVKNFKDSAYYPTMIIDRKDVIHAISSEQGVNLGVLNTQGLSYEAIMARYPCAFCSDLIYRRSTDGGKTWSSPVNISRTLEGSERPDLLEGSSGRLYLSWTEGKDWYAAAGVPQDVRIVYSDDGGSTWSDPIILTGDGTKPTSQIALTETRDGGMLAVWRYEVDTDQHLYYQRSTDSGVTWTEPEPLPTIVTDSLFNSQLDRYALLTDLAGTVHLFAVGYDETSRPTDQPRLYHAEYRQGRWSPPEVLYSGPYKPEWPVAAVGPRNELHVAWFVRVGNATQAGDVGDVYIYYAKRSETMPDNPVAVAYVPTVMPTPQPTDVPVFEATSTPVPTLAPIDASINVHRNQDLNAIEVLLGVVFSVGVLCVGVLIILGFRPRL